MVVGFLTLWVKMRYGESKIDANTELTKVGTTVAAENAMAAADRAAEAKLAAENLSSQFNGVLDKRITKIVKEHIEPLVIAFKAHSEQDDHNMKEIRTALIDLRKGLKQ